MHRGLMTILQPLTQVNKNIFQYIQLNRYYTLLLHNRKIWQIGKMIITPNCKFEIENVNQYHEIYMV